MAQHVLGYQPSLNVIRMLEPLPAIVVEGEQEAEQHLLVRGVRKAWLIWAWLDDSGWTGLTPKKYQSGETDVTGRISKIGDASVRTALHEAANVILTRPVKGSSLKSWAMRVATRAGMRKAKVALARKLAVVLHRMLVDGTEFAATKA
jgi:transposase